MDLKTENSSFVEDDIVISGISGRFPKCNNIAEFKKHLMDGVDMVGESNERWPVGFCGLPSRLGTIPCLKNFDAEFFGVHAQLAQKMDPQSRLLLETTFEALLDAGVNPCEIRGTNTGVFVALWENESNDFWRKDVRDANQNSLLGCTKSLFANRIAYEFDFCGPALCIDTACSSSLVALHSAVLAIKSGECEAAIVAGTNVCLLPQISLQLHKLGVLSSRGWCNTFDLKGDGYVRSEAVVVLYIQRATVARRIYASILGSRVNSCGNTGKGLTHPSSQMQYKLLKELYDQLKINGSDVAYVEAHGTGTRAGDVEEADSLFKMFCTNRKDSLMVGSVKSNMGHSESVSGLCSVAKVVIAMEQGIIPKNLHHTEPNPNIIALTDGHIKVITENQKWDVGIVGISSTGLGGTNSHVVLRPNNKPKVSFDTPLRLVIASGRTEEAVTHFLSQLEKYKDDAELQALVYNIFCSPVAGHEYRGYKVLGDHTSEIEKIETSKRTVWFVYTGMGSQWSGMGKHLMEFEMFRQSIEKCADILLECNIDLKRLLLDADNIALESTLNAFVCIVSIQIALTDIIKILEIEPDGIIGHSLGEIACGYCDGLLTRYQALMTAYLRGKSFQEESMIPGGMASVGLTWEECAKLCPPQVFPACHNAKDNVTVSGEAKAVQKFVIEMQSKNIFARVLKNCKYAFHTKYVGNVGANCYANLKTIIPHPKLRSSKWLSTSVPEDRWKSTFAKTCSAEYLVNNIAAPVLFYETLRHVPQNAIVIEISPHGLLKSIIHRTLGPKSHQFSFINRDHPDNLHYFMSAIGRLYNVGLHPKVSNLYKPVTFPVGRGTPMISSFIKWKHCQQWEVANYFKEDSNSAEEVFTVDTGIKEYKYLLGHCIDGRVIFPAAGYIVFAWKALAKLLNKNFEEMPVLIKNIKFHTMTVLTDKPTKFLVNIFKVSGEFQIRERGVVVASGAVTTYENTDQKLLHLPKLFCKNELLTSEDVYTELRMRGFEFSGLFKGIIESEKMQGKLQWNNNWVTFIDAMLQFYLLGVDTRGMYLPTKIQHIVISPEDMPEKEVIEINASWNLRVAKSKAVEIRGISNIKAQRTREDCKPKLETYQFISLESHASSIVEALTILSQLVLENTGLSGPINVHEISGEPHYGSTIKTVLELEPKVSVNYSIAKLPNTETTVVPENTHLVVLSGILDNIKALNGVSTFVLSEENEPLNTEIIKDFNLEVISTQIVPSVLKTYVLLRRTVDIVEKSTVLQISNTNFEWIGILQTAIQSTTKIYLVAQNEALSGLNGLVSCLIQEIGNSRLRSFFLQNQEVERFSLNCPFYIGQVKKDLVFNVLDNKNNWGTYRYLPLDVSQVTSTEHAFIAPATKGDLMSLRWVQSSIGHYTASISMQRCTVYYASLNFRDVLLATGQLSPNTENGDERECFLGFEFSGRDSTERRVMGMLSEGSLATNCDVSSDLLLEVPEHWSLEEAATVPVAYATCYYAMVLQGQIQPGESILIHAGAGGVGQAAISIALHNKCNVFTTVGSQVKREFLTKRFPQINIKHIGNSRDTTFEQLVMTQTNGIGVDMVLNCLTGDKLLASVRCLAKGGRFLELGKMDMINHQTIALETFLDNRAFMGIALDEIIRSNIPLIKHINNLISVGIANGSVIPLSTEIFTKENVTQAFKLMATGQHIGKVLIKIREEKNSKHFCPIVAVSRTYMKPEKSYIVIGGLGSFGLELTKWLVVKGATKIILSSRFGIKTGYQRYCTEQWKQRGVKVLVVNLDAALFKDATKLLEEAKALGPVGGIFNLAMERQDALMENQTQSSFESAAKSKIDTTQNLDTVSRILAPSLDYFVVFSSFACGRGNIGQSNYGFANSAMERICEQRYVSGLPALAIQWGPVGDVGYFVNNDLYAIDITPQKITSCLNTLDLLLQKPHPVISSYVLAKALKTEHASRTTVEDTIGTLLGVKDLTKVNQTSTLVQLGMDSLLAVDIKVELERKHDLVLTTQEIQALTFQRLRELSAPKPVNQSTVKASIFVVHACEGYGDAFRFLDAPVCDLHITVDDPTTSIGDLAEYYVHQLTRRHPGPYVLIGYSLSSCLVFEMGLRLQLQHHNVQLIFIQSSHAYFAPGLVYKDLLANPANAIAHYPPSLFKEQTNRVKKLSTLTTFDQKISYATEVLPKTLSMPKDKIAEDEAFWRIAATYMPSSTFKSNVILINYDKEAVKRRETYELDKVCEKPIEIYELNCDEEMTHMKAYMNEIVKKVVNRF